ncbi:MAG: DMT family transporter, partial [Thermoplasmata archaeon]
MAGIQRSVVVPSLASLLAAALWASYYVIVLLAAPFVAPSAILAYPFVVGGVAYLAFIAFRHEGAVFWASWRDPWSWIRTGFVLGMQVTVLASTFLTGAVDTAIFALIGDVVVSPLLVMVLLGERRDRLRSLPFPLGLTLAMIGASLTIVGGQSIARVSGWGLVLAPLVPLMVAGFFMSAAHDSRSKPASVVVGNSMVAAGVIGIVIAPLIPGGIAGLRVTGFGPWSLILLLGLTSFFLADVLFFWAIGKVGPLAPTTLMAAIPAFTLGFQLVFLHEAPSDLSLIGIPIAVLGAALSLQGSHTSWAQVPGPPTDA